MAEPKGVLIAMMQPSPSEEEEFHDWYDTEHLSERASCQGFLNAKRFVCIDGFPRYVAIYDLAYHGVLKEPGYLAISGTNFSPWSKRVLARVHGQMRLEGPQIYPGEASYGDTGKPARMALIRFRGMKPDAGAAIVQALRKIFDNRPEFLQLRVWRSNYHDDLAFIAMVEGDAALTLEGVDLSPLGELRRNIDLRNLYIEYWRRGVLQGVYK